jgi:NADPH:quinone reductase-like Zn-dependent oxidoreductase
MKAIRIHAYGGPDVLRFEDVPASEAGANEVRVKVQAAGVNPIDSKIRAGDLKEKIPLPLPWTPGYDFSGVTDDGLEVFGKTDPPAQGSYAEYVIVKRSSIATKPSSIDHRHSAAVPLAGLTAWQGLFGVGATRGLDLRSGQTLLILGAAGGVGSFATQLARWKGLRVLALVRPGQEDHVRRLGAKEVFDLETVGEVDGVLDLIGGDIADRAWANVKRGGALASTLGAASNADAAARDARAVPIFTQTDASQLRELGTLLDSGTLRVEVNRTFPLGSAAAAHEALAAGTVHGKVILTI